VSQLSPAPAAFGAEPTDDAVEPLLLGAITRSRFLFGLFDDRDDDLGLGGSTFVDLAGSSGNCRGGGARLALSPPQ